MSILLDSKSCNIRYLISFDVDNLLNISNSALVFWLKKSDVNTSI